MVEDLEKIDRLLHSDDRVHWFLAFEAGGDKRARELFNEKLDILNTQCIPKLPYIGMTFAGQTRKSIRIRPKVNFLGLTITQTFLWYLNSDENLFSVESKYFDFDLGSVNLNCVSLDNIKDFVIFTYVEKLKEYLNER